MPKKLIWVNYASILSGDKQLLTNLIKAIPMKNHFRVFFLLQESFFLFHLIKKSFLDNVFSQWTAIRMVKNCFRIEFQYNCVNYLYFISEYADCLCNLGRYREASLIYARTFSTNHEKKSLNQDRLKHFIRLLSTYFIKFVFFLLWNANDFNVLSSRSLTKVTTESVVNSGVGLSKLDNKFNQTDNSALVCLPGQTCPDPLSCPVCAGVLCNPIRWMECLNALKNKMCLDLISYFLALACPVATHFVANVS